MIAWMYTKKKVETSSEGSKNGLLEVIVDPLFCQESRNWIPIGSVALPGKGLLSFWFHFV